VLLIPGNLLLWILFMLFTVLGLDVGTTLYDNTVLHHALLSVADTAAQQLLFQDGENEGAINIPQAETAGNAMWQLEQSQMAWGPWDQPVSYSFSASPNAPQGYDDTVTVSVTYDNPWSFSNAFLQWFGVAQVFDDKVTVSATRTVPEAMQE